METHMNLDGSLDASFMRYMVRAKASADEGVCWRCGGTNDNHKIGCDL
jgi:hypothetical protein